MIRKTVANVNEALEGVKDGMTLKEVSQKEKL